MKRLLRIDTSLRKIGSYSRALADFYQEQWQWKNPGGIVIYRDLVSDNIHHISNKTVEAFFVEEPSRTLEQQQLLAVSDKLIQEFLGCDEILLSSPLYNLTISSVLKTYIDHIVRVNHTFKYSDDGQSIVGLANSKKVRIITVKGGIYKGTPYENDDFQDRYLLSIMNFIGIKDVAFFSLEGTSKKDHLKNEVFKIKELITNHINKNGSK